MADSLAQPLNGVRVLDLSRVLAGPFCSMILADLGADVIKVERPGRGDDTREWGPPFIDGRDDMSAYFASVNRNKRSVTLDLGNPAGRPILEKMIARSDVLLENFLPSSATRIGLSPDQLQRINPRLVACSISGFGRTGPLADVPGYDFVVQALGGLMAITGEPAGQPMKVGVALTDIITGLYAAVSVVAAIRSDGLRSAVSDPQSAIGNQPFCPRFRHIDLSLFDCTLAAMVNVAQSYLVTGRRPERYGNAHPQIVPYECFSTADGHLVLAVGNDAQWQRFCAAANRADLAADSRYATNRLRVANRVALVVEIAAMVRERTSADWTRLLAGADVPHAPVMAVDEAFAHPQVAARSMMVQSADGLKLVGNPIRFDGESPAVPRSPPQLGEHTADVLAELGYSVDDVARLRREGVI
jgi:crotonobetainyl-CoA:carnitine CoA-transferase CaiB-like acyl-CoA transferase